MLDHVRRLVPTTIRKNYAVKFGIALLILGLSVGAIGFVGTAQLTESVEQSTLEDQELLAGQEATALDNWNAENERVTEDAAHTLSQYEDEEATQDYLDGLSAEFDDAYFVDGESDEVLASTDDEAETVEDLGLDDSGVLDAGQTIDAERTEPYLNDAGDTMVAYHIGVGGIDDRILVFTYDVSDRSSEFASYLDDSTVTVVVNGDGEIVSDDTVFGSGAEAFLAEYEDGDGFLEEALEGADEDHSGASEYQGLPSPTIQESPYELTDEGYVGAYHGTEMGWVVLTHTPTDEAYGFVDTVDDFGTYATVAGVLLITVVGAVIGRNTATSIDRLTRKVGEMEEGNLDVDFTTSRVDNIGRLYDGFASMRDELREQIVESQEARSEAEEARERAESERERVQQLNSDLERAAEDYCDVMETASEGDLTVRMDTERTDNETMRQIGAEFNGMLAEIEDTIERLNRFASEVATASEEVTASSEEVRSASEQVTGSVQEIADGAATQHESLQSVDSEMSNLSTTTEEIAASSNEVADLAERTATTGQQGREAAQEAVQAANTLEAEREAVVEEFDQLQEEVKQIELTLNTIADIADQTNMLALNANIEASRSSSGQGAGGFGAVANEVKELSQDTKEATEAVGDRLEGLKEQTDRSATEVERTSEEIERVTELVTNAVDALDEIATYAQDTNQGVQEISAATEEQAASTQEVVAMVDEIATISEETTAEVENVAATTEEQTTAMGEVSNSANDLSEQAMTLSAALDRFDTAASEASAASDRTGSSEAADEPPEGTTASDDGDGTSPEDVTEMPAAEPVEVTPDDESFEFVDEGSPSGEAGDDDAAHDDESAEDDGDANDASSEDDGDGDDGSGDGDDGDDSQSGFVDDDESFSFAN